MPFELNDELDRFFEEQISTWPMLRQGVENLRTARNRIVDINGYTVAVRHLPHRIASTTAVVDTESVAKRPCFLCSTNLPVEEKGLSFDSNYTIYCNPFPILDRHMTIVHREHRPQRLAGQVPVMIELARSLPGYFIIYNGPACGASAPDHLHFQACRSDGVPVIVDADKAVDGTIPNYARHARVFRSSDATMLAELLHSTIGSHEPEPTLNLAVFRRSEELVAVLFPRKKHRPDVYYSGKWTVSPAAIDLCGVFVTPREGDFERITSEDIKAIYEEVSG